MHLTHRPAGGCDRRARRGITWRKTQPGGEQIWSQAAGKEDKEESSAEDGPCQEVSAWSDVGLQSIPGRLCWLFLRFLSTLAAVDG